MTVELKIGDVNAPEVAAIRHRFHRKEARG
ncbi:hypothetical protein CBA19CS22_18040 [Caballeronia novacaledonica]|uniref:Uncharacterized protein n=1 Tax=Caballeronia novacaledonica TaxID=1544861 RepID=A0ACB5QUU7_9BURK|nr:hypothetical protein CBA19CS22_18040 [Caballeronia novacaledonica]